MKKKVVCIFGNTLYYGHERSNVQVLTVLKEEGMDLLTLCNKEGLAPEAKRVFNLSDITYKPITFPSWKDVRKPFKLGHLLRHAAKVFRHNWEFLASYRRFRPDFILIGNDFMYINLIPSFLLVRAKIIYRLGDEPSVSWAVFKLLWKRYIVKRTFRFVCISRFIKEALRAAGRSSSASDVVIYNYPPVRSGVFKEKNLFNKRTFVIGYLGQIIEMKGVEMFVDAAIALCREYGTVSFVLAGDLAYDRAFSNVLLSKVSDSGLSQRIIFLGQIENIADFFEKVDVLATPSIKEEPLGNVLVEAKSYKTASIIFSTGGMPELITHGANGYICADVSTEALKEGMEYYIKAPALAVQHGQNAYNSIRELELDYEHFTKKWMEVFN